MNPFTLNSEKSSSSVLLLLSFKDKGWELFCRVHLHNGCTRLMREHIELYEVSGKRKSVNRGINYKVLRLIICTQVKCLLKTNPLKNIRAINNVFRMIHS